jgi:hypothetical protein
MCPRNGKEGAHFMTDFNCRYVTVAMQRLFQLGKGHEKAVEVATIGIVERDIPNLTGGHHDQFS